MARRGALFEIASYAGYVVLFPRGLRRRRAPDRLARQLRHHDGGVAATRLLATAGLGGIALTGWALSRLGMARHELTRGLTTFYVALYGVFMLSLVLVGSGLRTGLLPGPAPFGVTVVPPRSGVR